MTILDSKGNRSPTSTDEIIVRMLYDWLKLKTVQLSLLKLGTFPSPEVLGRLAAKKMDPGEAALLFKKILSNKRTRRLIVQRMATLYPKQTSIRDANKDLDMILFEIKHLSHASKAGLIIP